MAKPRNSGTRASRKRRGSGEDMTGANENTVEVRGVGDNSQLPLPAPDDLDHHKKNIKGWKEKVATAQRGLQQAKAAAKKAHINLKSLDLVVSIERDNDPVAALDFFRQVDLGLKGSESTLRISVHDTLAGDEKDLVARRGYEDGKAGRTPDNKYPEGSDLANLYNENWQKGQADLLGVNVESQVEQNENA